MNALKFLPLILLPIAALVVSSCFIAVSETEHVILTQFGEVKGEPISEPGLRFKVPFIQKANRLEKRLLNWDGRPIEIPTKDKAYISVNTFARWRITDPRRFFLRLRDTRNAASKLEDILGSETRNLIARHELIELVRTDRTRRVQIDESLKATTSSELPPISVGRVTIEEEIKRNAAPKLEEFGINLLDVRLKRVNYNGDVLERVYQRMISERQQIAARFRSEGEAEAARIAGDRERDLNEIESTAYKRVQELRGQADAEAARIYAEAYGGRAGAPEFYRFLKGLETLRKSVRPDSTLVLSTESDLFQLLKRAGADAEFPLPPPGAEIPSQPLLPAPQATPPVPPDPQAAPQPAQPVPVE